MLPVVILVVIILLFFGASLLPRLGRTLGERARKPYRQARWMWAWASGTEEEAIRAETEYGRECAREFSAQFSGAGSEDDRKLVAGIGARLAAAVNDPRRAFRFEVVAHSRANAFALPGGFVYMTKALLDLCGRDRDEIAFFLGHEIGHVVCGHARDKVAAGAILNAVASRLGGIGRMIHELLAKGYSRTLELDADREAVRLAASAGFDSAAAIRALRRLAETSPDNKGLGEYFSTHPALDDRIKELADMQNKRPR
ncbi:MAG TPA: M48 family metallopeptidase [Acidobacteriota bacterium]|nr:M48 family metallopeptidase [Acidobacteriota bacterium]